MPHGGSVHGLTPVNNWRDGFRYIPCMERRISARSVVLPVVRPAALRISRKM